jgi:hypothetical protein
LGSGAGIASEEFDTEKFADGDDFAAAIAFTTDAYFSAPQVAGATSPVTEETFLAARTLIDRLGDQPVFAPQLISDVGERGGVRLTAAESERLLTAARFAETAAADGLERCATHRAGRQRLAIVTRIVTHGVRAHAATAGSRSAAWVSLRRS